MNSCVNIKLVETQWKILCIRQNWPVSRWISAALLLEQLRQMEWNALEVLNLSSGFFMTPKFTSRDVRNTFLISVWFRFGSWKKTQIRFGMNLVRFGLQKLGSVRIVIYYWCRLIVEYIQIYSKYYTTMVNELCILDFDTVVNKL